MDQAAAKFKGLTADIRKVSHTEVVNMDEVREGTIAVKRFKPHDTRIRIDFTNPRPRMVCDRRGESSGRTNPKTNGSPGSRPGKESRMLVNQFMLLGFGSNSSELKAAYTVTLGGSGPVNGEKATRIELVPKSRRSSST